MKATFLRLDRNLIIVVWPLLACHAEAQTTFERLNEFETGADPLPNLALGTDGNYYGATGNGGSTGLGSVFKLTPTGVLTTILSFNQTNGSYPEFGLVRGGATTIFTLSGQVFLYCANSTARLDPNKA